MLTKNSIASKAASKEILQNFQPFVANLDVQDAYSLLAKRGEDTLARSMLPDHFQQFLPLRSMADGNCLFNSTSIVLQGDDKLAGLLQLLVTCELIAHSEFYANHPTEGDDERGRGVQITKLNSGFRVTKRHRTRTTERQIPCQMPLTCLLG